MQQLKLLVLIICLTGCITMDNYITLSDAYNLQDFVDKKVKLTGKISEIPWQHMIGYFEEYGEFNYFDVQDYQIVIYSKSLINCKKALVIYGTVAEVSGQSKRQDSEEVYTEYHVIVDRWECGE